MFCCINQVDLRCDTRNLLIKCIQDFPRIKIVNVLTPSGDEGPSFVCAVDNGEVGLLSPDDFGYSAGQVPTEEVLDLVRYALAQLKEDEIFDEHDKCRCRRMRLRLY